MARYLSEPVLDKDTFTARGRAVYVAGSSMQNYRLTDEDEVTVYIAAPNDKDASFFGMYDGHGGPEVSRYVSKHLHRLIMTQPPYQRGDVQRALRQAFIEMDNMIGKYLWAAEKAGSTANVAIIKNNILYVANLGDSRAIACISGNIIPLSRDHKPDDPEEKARIERAGCTVVNHRVNGELAISRTFGDFSYKKRRKPPEDRAVSCIPEVAQYTINREWQFLLIGCDGIFDVFTSEDAGRFIKEKLEEYKTPEDALEELIDRCSASDGFLGGPGSDNVSGILVVFINNWPIEYRISLQRSDRPMTYERRPRSGRAQTQSTSRNVGRERPSHPLPTRRSERIRSRRMTN